jgi:RNA polymerase sigma-70 factor (ECF subfamily)
LEELESIWLIRVKKGESEAFTHLVEAYQKPVFNLCYRMLENAEDAEDAAQETFLRAYKSMNAYDSNRPFGTWLLSIAAHHCIDQIRKRRLKFISIDEEPYQEIKVDEPGPEGKMSNKESELQIQNLLETIGPVDRAAVVMYYWYDFPYEEIAGALHLSVSAVKSRLHRARRDMANTLRKDQSKTITLERKQYESPAF